MPNYQMNWFDRFRSLIITYVSLVVICFATVDAQTETSKTESNYILTAGDVISVQIFGQADLQSEQEVANDGSINMGLIGSIVIAPLSVVEAEEKIRKAYIEQRYLRNPQIIIKVLEYSPKLVSVLGQVNQPGSIQLPNDTNSVTLARVISMVGDFTDIAKQNEIRIVRKDAKGEEETIVVDMSDIGETKRKDRAEIDFLVYPNDVIFVPERWF